LALDVPPSPKSHSHVSGLPVDLSVNCTVSGASPVNGEAEKSAVIDSFPLSAAEPKSEPTTTASNGDKKNKTINTVICFNEHTLFTFYFSDDIPCPLEYPLDFTKDFKPVLDPYLQSISSIFFIIINPAARVPYRRITPQDENQVTPSLN
jgi:hypothetical protein